MITDDQMKIVFALDALYSYIDDKVRFFKDIKANKKDKPGYYLALRCCDDPTTLETVLEACAIATLEEGTKLPEQAKNAFSLLQGLYNAPYTGPTISGRLHTVWKDDQTAIDLLQSGGTSLQNITVGKYHLKRLKLPSMQVKEPTPEPAATSNTNGKTSSSSSSATGTWGFFKQN